MFRTWFVAGALVVAAGCREDEPVRPARAPGPIAPPVQAVAIEPPAPAPAPIVEVAEPPAPIPTPVLVVPEGYRARLKAAKQHAAAGRADEAEALYEKAAEAEPTRAAPHIEIARLRIDAKDTAGARKHAEAAVELEPGSSGAWNTLGRVELQDGDKLAAITAFEKSAEANPDNSFAWNNLGLVLSQLERWDEAVAALERATGGANPEPYMWNNLGVAYERTEKVELARAAYRQAARAGSQVARESLARLEGPKPVGDQAKVEDGADAPGVDELPKPTPAPTE